MSDARDLQVLRMARASDLGRYLRRLLGLRYLKRADFLPAVDAEEARRLEALSRRARGEGPAPVLILGVMPRCGSNFLRDLVALHPGTHPDPSELYEFPLLACAPAAQALRDEFVVRFPRNADKVGRYDLLAMTAGAWLRELQREAGDKAILLKDPHAHAIGLAPYIFADAKIVLCLRDGRDVIESTMKTFSRRSLARKTFGQLSQEWKLAAEAFASFKPGGENWHPNVLLVRYEDVVADLEGQVGKVLEHAGLPLDLYDLDAALSLPVRGSSRSSATGTDRWKPQDPSASFAPVRRWEAWSLRRKEQFRRIAGPSLRAAGYES
jgi:hypothetical protein